jgi:HAD superfamily hydrolase (TIGR01484 family)
LQKKVFDLQIKLIATDLDGTLIGRTGELPIYDDFKKRLEYLRSKYNTVWVVCTGRSLRGFYHKFSPMEVMGVYPEYIIVDHAYIYRRTKSGRYRPHYSWNFLIRYNIWSSRLYIKDAIEHWYKTIYDKYRGITVLYHRRNRLCVRFRTEEEAAAAAEYLKEEAKGFKYLRVFLYKEEVDVRMVPFTKGLALEELSIRLGIGKSSVLAIGNGHNDISMLDGVVAGITGCPANAETDVMATINRSGGHISAENVLAGVIDIIDASLENRINSELPGWWVSNAQKKNPRSSNRYINLPPKNRKAHSKLLKNVILGAGAAYVMLLIFARFGVVPHSSLIEKPLVMLIELIFKIFGAFG